MLVKAKFLAACRENCFIGNKLFQASLFLNSYDVDKSIYRASEYVLSLFTNIKTVSEEWKVCDYI